MRFGYNTNGFAHHKLEDALPILRDLGYQAVAITLEHTLLDPPDQRGVDACLRRLIPLLEHTGLTPTIETGSRFILDPRRKHQPTLLSHDRHQRQQRIEFLKAAVDVAAATAAESVSLWSGTPDDEAADDEHYERLTGSLREVLDHAATRDVRLSFEPEPGMFIDTMAKFEALCDRVDAPHLGLTIDVGHVYCLQDGDIADHVRRWRGRLWNLHIEDMRRGVHEHLMFGEGRIEFRQVVAALRSIRYEGPVHVELSRHSHDAVNIARRALEFLQNVAGGPTA